MIVLTRDGLELIFIEIQRPQDLQFAALGVDGKIVDLPRRGVLLEHVIERNRPDAVVTAGTA